MFFHASTELPGDCDPSTGRQGAWWIKVGERKTASGRAEVLLMRVPFDGISDVAHRHSWEQSESVKLDSSELAESIRKSRKTHAMVYFGRRANRASLLVAYEDRFAGKRWTRARLFYPETIKTYDPALEAGSVEWLSSGKEYYYGNPVVAEKLLRDAARARQK